MRLPFVAAFLASVFLMLAPVNALTVSVEDASTGNGIIADVYACFDGNCGSSTTNSGGFYTVSWSQPNDYTFSAPNYYPKTVTLSTGSATVALQKINPGSGSYITTFENVQGSINDGVTKAFFYIEMTPTNCNDPFIIDFNGNLQSPKWATMSDVKVSAPSLADCSLASSSPSEFKINCFTGSSAPSYICSGPGGSLKTTITATVTFSGEAVSCPYSVTDNAAHITSDGAAIVSQKICINQPEKTNVFSDPPTKNKGVTQIPGVYSCGEDGTFRLQQLCESQCGDFSSGVPSSVCKGTPIETPEEPVIGQQCTYSVPVSGNPNREVGTINPGDKICLSDPQQIINSLENKGAESSAVPGIFSCKIDGSFEKVASCASKCVVAQRNSDGTVSISEECEPAPENPNQPPAQTVTTINFNWGDVVKVFTDLWAWVASIFK